MKIRKSTVVVKTLAQKAKEARAEAKAKKLAEMKVEFRKRDKKALELEKQLGENEHQIMLWNKIKDTNERKLKTAQRKHDAAMRRIDREEKRLKKQLESIIHKRATETRKLEAAKSQVNNIEKIIAKCVQNTPKLQARVDAAFKRKNSLEDRIAKQVKAPKEYDLSK